MATPQKYQSLCSISEVAYFSMEPEEFDTIQPQIDAILVALDESMKREDVWSATNLALLLPTWMVADKLDAFSKRLEELASSRVRQRDAMSVVHTFTATQGED